MITAWHSGLNWTENDINVIITTMRKKIISVLFIVLSLALTGCGALVQIPEMSEKEEELITEYAAGLMIKYDTRFGKSNLLDEEELEDALNKEKLAREKERAYKKAAEEYLEKKNAAKKESEKNKADSEASQNNSSSDSDNQSGEGTSMNPTIDDIASFYGIDGFDVRYTGYELCKSYSDSVLMDVDADPGKQLLVLEFDVSNVTSEVQNFDMFYKTPGFSVNIDGGSKIKSQGTLMFDDMSAYVGEIGPGASQSMVLIFEIDENIGSFGSLVLNAKNGSDKGSIILQ